MRVRFGSVCHRHFEGEADAMLWWKRASKPVRASEPLDGVLLI